MNKDDRLDLLTGWVRQFDGLADAEPVPASTDASFRRYFRVRGRDSYIVMDAPPAEEDSQSFITIAGYLRSMQINVPEIIEADLDQGFLLISDLGSLQYLTELEQNPEAATDLYADAIDALLVIQSAGNKYRKALPVYDEALLRFELSIFREWLCDSHLGIEFSDADQTNWQACCDVLVSCALQQPRVFMHRDYHSRNLMVTAENNPGVLDFQGALNGPYSYDLVSLLRDCYIQWPADFVEKMVVNFHKRCGHSVSLDDFRRDFDLTGMQRQLKAAGLFARLLHRDGKTGYLKDVPRTLGYVAEATPRYAELAFLSELISERVLPALAETMQ